MSDDVRVAIDHESVTYTSKKNGSRIRRKTVKFKIQRRAKEGAPPHWETFEIPYRRNLNVISA